MIFLHISLLQYKYIVPVSVNSIGCVCGFLYLYVFFCKENKQVSNNTHIQKQQQVVYLTLILLLSKVKVFYLKPAKLTIQLYCFCCYCQTHTNIDSHVSPKCYVLLFVYK